MHTVTQDPQDEGYLLVVLLAGLTEQCRRDHDQDELLRELDPAHGKG